MTKTDREPCPWRIVEDAGGAFMFGLVGGSVYHSIGGARNAPKGQMMSQAVSRVRARVPMLGGSFAVWGTLFSGFDCTLTAVRHKEDPWNPILAGAATGGILAMRAGLKAAGKSAFFGGVILAAIEGLNVLMMRVIMPKFEAQQNEAGIPVDRMEPPIDPSRLRRHKDKKPQALWQPEQAASPLFQAEGSSSSSSSGGRGGGEFAAPSSEGFGSPSSGFGAPDPFNSSSSQQSEPEAKPFYKFW